MKITKYNFDKKKILIEIIFLVLFLSLGLKYFGIPDRYDFYIYLILLSVFILALSLYSKIFIQELKEILDQDYIVKKKIKKK